MATEDDAHRTYCELEKRGKVVFGYYLRGIAGSLTTKSLKDANVDSVDVRYRVMEKGTKLYSRRYQHHDVHVFSVNLQTLLPLINLSTEGARDGDGGVECIVVYEVVDDVCVMEVREDVVQRASLLWCLDVERSDVDGAVKENGDGAGTVVNSDLQSEMSAKYEKLLKRTSPTSKNLLDNIMSSGWRCPSKISAILYTRMKKDYGVLVSQTNRKDVEFLKIVQEFLLPRKSMDDLIVDREGYVKLQDSYAFAREIDCTDGSLKFGDAKTGSVDTLSSSGPDAEADRSYPTMEEYNDYQYSDNSSLVYEDIRSLPDTSKVSPRPAQPPPLPPVAEPVYSTVNKSAKKQVTRMDNADRSDPMATRPPRPPPLDSIPLGEGESPPQISVQSKPSRPAAPPTIRRKATDGSMGSSGNVSLDGRDEVLSPPPRGTQKGKGRTKSESTKF